MRNLRQQLDAKSRTKPHMQQTDLANLRDGTVEWSEAIKGTAGDARRGERNFKTKTGSDNQEANRSESRQEMWQVKTVRRREERCLIVFHSSSRSEQTTTSRPRHAANYTSFTGKSSGTKKQQEGRPRARTGHLSSYSFNSDQYC